MKIMLAPVVLFVYNRLDHTSRVLETLGKNELAKDTELYVFSDAAKSEKGLDKVNAVREYINEQIADWSGALYDFWKEECWEDDVDD